MEATQATENGWWVGSNGNLFCDYNDFRYCIAPVSRSASDGYTIARNGIEVARSPSVAEAKLYVKRARRLRARHLLLKQNFM